MADILEGYFPIHLKNDFPNGILLEVVDKIDEMFLSKNKQEKNTLNNNKSNEKSENKNFEIEVI